MGYGNENETPMTMMECKDRSEEKKHREEGKRLTKGQTVQNETSTLRTDTTDRCVALVWWWMKVVKQAV